MIRRSFLSLFLLFSLAGAARPADKKSVSDDSLYDQVRRRLASDPLVKGGGLQVDVKDGVVTLRGTVDAENQKNKATKLTKKIKGVKSVDNQIQVKEKGR